MAAVLVTVSLALSACGSRQSHEALQRALVVNGSAAANAGGNSGGDVSGGTAVTNGGGTPVGTVTGTGGGGGTGGVSGGTGGSRTGSGVLAGGTGGAATGGATTGGSRAGTGGGKVGATNVGRTNVGTKPGATGGKLAAGNPATGAGSAGGSTARRCTGTEQPLIIGSVGEQSGIAGAVTAFGPKMVSVWAAAINSQGGLACHQVKYIVADDGGDPARNASLTQQLVEQDHVVAFVNNNDALAYSGSESYLVSHGIPVIGSDATYTAIYNHPNFFPQISSGDYAMQAVFGAASTSLSATDKQAFGVLSCQENETCTYVAKQASALAQKYGLKLVYTGSVSITQPDYSAVCNAAKQAGVKALLANLDGNSLHRLGRSCAGVSFHPTFFAESWGTTPDIPSDSNLDGMVLASVTHPFTDNSNASIAEMNNVIAHFAPGLPNSGQTVHGWASAQLLQYAGRFLPAKATLTSADILAAMEQVKGTDLGGLTYPMNFVKGKNATPVVCWWSVGVKGGKFVGLNNKRTCS